MSDWTERFDTAKRPSVIEFLKARLDEDEAIARAATPGPWGSDGEPRVEGATGTGAYSWSSRTVAEGIMYGDMYESMEVADAAHIARHDPARVLREVEAKRAIIEAAEEASNLDMSVDLDRRVGVRDEAEEPYLGNVILWALAAAYSDHPDYDFGWAPDTLPARREKP